MKIQEDEEGDIIPTQSAVDPLPTASRPDHHANTRTVEDKQRGIKRATPPAMPILPHLFLPVSGLPANGQPILSAPPASLQPSSPQRAWHSISRSFLYCPITNKLLDDPGVVIPDGNFYERSAIVERGDVPSEIINSNRALKSIVNNAVDIRGD